MIDLPPKVGKAFLKDMKAYFAESDQIKADEIAARQLHALKQHLPVKQKLRLVDVIKLFHEMRDHSED